MLTSSFVRSFETLKKRLNSGMVEPISEIYGYPVEAHQVLHLLHLR